MRISEDSLRTKQFQMTSFPVENDNESKIGGIKDLGLKNLMQQSHLHYLFSVRLRNYRTKAMFSIVKYKKIDQNGLKLDNLSN